MHSILKNYGVHPIPWNPSPIPWNPSGKSVESIWKEYEIHPQKVWNPSPIPCNPSPIPCNPPGISAVHPPFHGFHMDYPREGKVLGNDWLSKLQGCILNSGCLWCCWCKYTSAWLNLDCLTFLQCHLQDLIHAECRELPGAWVCSSQWPQVPHWSNYPLLHI